MCALREFLLGLVFFIRPWRREGVKFDIQLWVDFAVVIFFSVDRLNRCQRKKGLYSRTQAGILILVKTSFHWSIFVKIPVTY